MVQWVKNMPAMQERQADGGSISRSERFPGGGHGSPLLVFLPGDSPWTEEPGGYSS